jgi:hypothetical protein
MQFREFVKFKKYGMLFSPAIDPGIRPPPFGHREAEGGSRAGAEAAARSVAEGPGEHTGEAFTLDATVALASSSSWGCSWFLTAPRMPRGERPVWPFHSREARYIFSDRRGRPSHSRSSARDRDRCRRARPEAKSPVFKAGASAPALKMTPKEREGYR